MTTLNAERPRGVIRSLAGILASVAFLASGAMKLAWPDASGRSGNAPIDRLREFVTNSSAIIGGLEVAIAGILLLGPLWLRPKAWWAAMSIVFAGTAYLLWLRAALGSASQCSCFGRLIRLDTGTHLLFNGTLLLLLLASRETPPTHTERAA